MAQSNDFETWLPIPGYEHSYEVSSLGRVLRLPGPRCRQGRVRKLRVNRHGYVDVNLCQNNRVATHTVHSLIMLAFVGPRPDGYEIRHLNGLRTDNRLTNLAYGTPSENRHDIVRHGHNPNANKTHCSRGHEFTPENTKVIPSRPGGRYCLACREIYNAERRIKT